MIINCIKTNAFSANNKLDKEFRKLQKLIDELNKKENKQIDL